MPLLNPYFCIVVKYGDLNSYHTKHISIKTSSQQALDVPWYAENIAYRADLFCKNNT